MRTRKNRFPGTSRRALRATVITAAITGISLLSGPTAAASTVMPENPQKSCGTAVHGVIGDTVAITGESVRDIVNKGANRAKEILLISELAIWDEHLSRVIANEGTIPVGEVADAKSTDIPGETIGAAVVERLEGEAGLGVKPDKTLGIIADTVARNCGLTAFASNYTEPTTTQPDQRDERSDDDSGTTPRNNSDSSDAVAGTSGGTGDTRAPRRDYSDVPAVPTPSADIATPPDMRYSPDSGQPQPSPQIDVLGQTAKGNSSTSDQPAVREAGNADALAKQTGQDRVQLPMLLAVVALAMVTAALVRTWVLRRT